jgi:hypothetical protein
MKVLINNQEFKFTWKYEIPKDGKVITHCEIWQDNTLFAESWAKMGKKQKQFCKDAGRKVSMKKCLIQKLDIFSTKELRKTIWEEYFRYTNNQTVLNDRCFSGN